MAEEKVRYFEFRDDKSNKFWEMSWSGTSFTVRYGKIGADGRTSTKSFPSADEAKAAANKLMLTKHAKGYVYIPRSEASAEHWYERYREHYRDWWREIVADLDEDEREDLAEFEHPDELHPLEDEELQRVIAAFPELPEPLRSFLTTFGAGQLHFPTDDGEPLVYSVFSPDEVEERLESIAAQASYELEQLDEPYHRCSTHGQDVAKCRALLTAVRDNPGRYYPFFGPESPFDFVYVVQGSPGAGSVGRWYHDYPVCELLDGSGITESLEVYGQKLLDMAREGDASPV